MASETTNTVMGLSYDTSWDIFEGVFARRLPVAEAWSIFIDEHQSVHPAHYWDKLRKLHSSEEEDRTAYWLDTLVASNPIPDSILALWIGISMYIDRETEREFYAYYVHGAEEYVQNDIEWAVFPTYEPEEKYFIPQVINQLRETIRTESNDFGFLDWILPIAYSSFLFDDVIRVRLNKVDFLKHRDKIFVTIGFDDGDYKELTAIENTKDS